MINNRLNAIPNALHESLKTASKQGDISKQLFESYEQYKETSITNRRFKHKDIVPLIEALPFEKKVVGQSFENRNIYQIKLGTGKIKLLLWSQMHGDESTSTMALFDIFKFFQGKDDGFDDFRQQILEKCTLYFVPMLNPDGAERFQRRTATEIDMNRDALRLQTPEGILLKQLQKDLTPDFAFNLHDQGTRTSAGNSPKQATISFLATAYDAERNWNKIRTRSMQVICSMNKVLQQFIAGHVARYSDEHEPRAFGDNIQKWGSSLILIESGGFKDDTEKQFIRKLNFVAILSAFNSILTGNYKKNKLKNYEALPINDGALFDILVRNVQFIENGKTIIKDIGINLNERNTENATAFTLESRIEDLGDLSTFWGITEIDGTGLTLKMPLDYNNSSEKWGFSIKQLQAKNLKRGDEATFILEKNGAIDKVFINGLLKN
jgi:Zinc carboxypeptidase